MEKVLHHRFVGPWNRLHRDMVTAPNLTEFNEGLDNALRHKEWLLGCPGQSKELDFDDPCRSLPTQNTLWFCDYLAYDFRKDCSNYCVHILWDGMELLSLVTIVWQFRACIWSQDPLSIAWEQLSRKLGKLTKDVNKMLANCPKFHRRLLTESWIPRTAKKGGKNSSDIHFIWKRANNI